MHNFDQRIWTRGQSIGADVWRIRMGTQSECPNHSIQKLIQKRCPSKIRYGLGPVPDSYFIDQSHAMPDYDQLTTVYAGDKHLIELKAKAHTRIGLVFK